jgi:hypothetical protein
MKKGCLVSGLCAAQCNFGLFVRWTGKTLICKTSDCQLSLSGKALGRKHAWPQLSSRS